MNILNLNNNEGDGEVYLLIRDGVYLFSDKDYALDVDHIQDFYNRQIESVINQYEESGYIEPTMEEVIPYIDEFYVQSSSHLHKELDKVYGKEVKDNGIVIEQTVVKPNQALIILEEEFDTLDFFHVKENFEVEDEVHVTKVVKDDLFNIDTVFSELSKHVLIKDEGYFSRGLW